MRNGIIALATAALWTSSAPATYAGEPGHLQIMAPAGVVAELDGRMSARSQDRYGIIIRDLQPGPHQLLLSRPGAEPQRAIVQIATGQVTVFAPRAWAPSVAQAESTGMLMLQTLPVVSIIKAPTLGWPKLAKTAAPIHIVAPAGDHRVTVCDEYRCLDYRLNVAAGRLRSVLVDLDRGDVDDLSAAHATMWARYQRECEAAKTGDATSACERACELDSAFLPGNESAACAQLMPEDEPLVAIPASAAPMASVPTGGHGKEP